MRKIPRLLIAGTHSGAGKTTITTGLMAALTRRGFNLQPFKVGPDYIDPGYHTLVTGNVSRNLDVWLVGEEKIQDLFLNSAVSKDICLIEGVMGLYDGIKGTTSLGSSAHIAKLLKVPVILVMDVRSMARSAAAVALGYKLLEPGLNIAGIVLNKVGSLSHYQMVREAVEAATNIPVVGYLPKNKQIELPERHLGLVTTAEGENLSGLLDKTADLIEETIDIEALIGLANNAETIEDSLLNESSPKQPRRVSGSTIDYSVRIGVARDNAFSFYYQDGLEIFEALGAELVTFSPISDDSLPKDLDGVIIGGGYPEMFLVPLSQNKNFIQSLKNEAQRGIPIYAECGGQMYLSEAIIDFEGKEYPMAGLVQGVSKMQKRLVAMGYVTATANTDNILLKAGESYRGHEFHYSSLEQDEASKAFQLTKNRDGSTREEGFATKNILTSYVHLHFAGFPRLAENFMEQCRAFHNWRGQHGK